MQKNWYLLYTKQKREKKVAALLTKRKIENFCPFSAKHKAEFTGTKVSFRPLFSSYVFVKTEETNIPVLKVIHNVLNVVYWKTQPAIIQEKDVEAIKIFVATYGNIRIEKILPFVKDEETSTHQSSYSINGNVLICRNKSIKINLLSLGVRMVAEVKENGVMEEKIIIRRKGADLHDKVLTQQR